MDVHLNEFNLPTRIASHDNARPPLSLDIFNLQQSAPAFRDSNMFINRAPLSSARPPSEVIANRPRSWSFGNSNAAQSVDSDNSEITNDLNRLLLAPNPAVRQGVAMLDFGKLEVAPCNSLSRAPPGQPLYSPTYQPGSRWTPKSPVTSRHFCTSDMERSHFSPVELETTERGISPDAIAITHPSPSAFPPSKGDRLAELGYGAGIAHDPRNRASSFTDYCRQDVAVLTPTLNPPDYGHPRTNVFNETRYENLVPDLHTIPQLCGLGEMDQSAYSAPSEFSPPRGPHSMPSNAWTETREHERFARNQQAGSRGYVGLSRMPDVGYESYNQGRSPFSVDSGFNSPRDPVMINNDPAYTRFNGYSRCSSPHTEYNSAKNTPRNNNPNILQHVNHRDMPPQIGPYKLLRHQIPHEDYYQRELMPEQEMSPPIDLQIEEYNDGNVYQVQFKRCYRCVKLPANSPFEIRLGEFVIVEADRGEDLGIVVAIAPGDSPHAASLYASSALSMRVTNRDLLKKIIRIADMNERADLQFKRQQEMTLLEICRGRARDTHALPITLVDAEYQFDRKKLVIYYVSSRRLDFRDFVRDLFAVYKTRIWMELATSNANFSPSSTVAVALHTGHLAVNPLIMANNNINTTPGPNQNLNQNQGALESPRCNPHPHVITPRMPERRSSLPSHPSAYQSRQFQSEHHQPHQQQGSNNLSTYEQNLQLQEMRLAQHPQRQSLRYNNDQKYMELQLLKERELNEELDRGIGSGSSENSNNYSTVVPY